MFNAHCSSSRRAISWLILLSIQLRPSSHPGIEVASADYRLGRENLSERSILFTDTTRLPEQAAKVLSRMGELALRAMDVTMGDQQSGGDERRFELVTGNFSWTQAKADAEDRGGKLACIKSAEDQSSVEAVMQGGSYWIGGTDEITEGQWKWVDGEAMSFENWAAGEPNDASWWRECPSDLR